MCNCKQTNGFNQKLVEAKQLTTETGESYVVYAKEIPGHGKHVFVIKEDSITDALGICCYFMPDGTEKIYTQISSIEVVDSVEVTSLKRTKRTKKDAKNIPEVTAETETISEMQPTPDSLV